MTIIFCILGSLGSNQLGYLHCQPVNRLNCIHNSAD